MYNDKNYNLYDLKTVNLVFRDNFHFSGQNRIFGTFRDTWILKILVPKYSLWCPISSLNRSGRDDFSGRVPEISALIMIKKISGKFVKILDSSCFCLIPRKI